MSKFNHDGGVLALRHAGNWEFLGILFLLDKVKVEKLSDVRQNYLHIRLSERLSKAYTFTGAPRHPTHCVSLFTFGRQIQGICGVKALWEEFMRALPLSWIPV